MQQYEMQLDRYDVIIIQNNGQALFDLVEILKKKGFKISSLEALEWYLGLRISIDKKAKTVNVDQGVYIEDMLNQYGYGDCNTLSTPMDTGDLPTKEDQPEAIIKEIITPFRSLLGKLSHLARFTRPDIKFAVFYLARYQAKPGEKHMKALKRILRYLKGTINVGLKLGTTNVPLVVYCDSDHAGCRDTRRSTSGYVCFVYGGAILTRSTQQKSVALSSTEAEVLALAICVKDVLWLRNLLEEFKVKIGKTTVYEDNQGAIYITNNSAMSRRAKHIATSYSFIREKVRKNLLKIEYVESKLNIADIFTKGLNKPVFERLAKILQGGLVV